MKKSIFLILIFFLSISSLTGQIPQTISYQGVLTDTSGTPLNGNYNLNFKFYTVPTSGSSIWAESQNVTVSNGIFNVILGSINPLNLPFDTTYWLGISVGSSNELGPRIQLTGSPYSLLARSVSDSSITTEKIVDGAVTGPKLSDSTLQAGSNVTITRQSNGALEIGATGGFSLPFSGSTSSSGAAFSIANTGTGLEVSSADIGLYVQNATGPTGRGIIIGQTDLEGILIGNTGSDGLYVGRALANGVYIDSAAMFGLYILNATYGVGIGTTTSNGIQVNQAGVDGIQIQSAGRDGVRVTNASEQGLLVQHAAGYGVRVDQVDQDGLYVGNAGQYGLEIIQATNHGVHIGQANDGVNIGTANGTGMVIGSAQRGVDILNTSSDGIFVHNPGYNGLEIDQAGNNGIQVNQTTFDGVQIQSAGRDGFRVSNATGHGVRVDQADLDGLYVGNAGQHGLFIQDAVSNGLEIDQAGLNGIQVNQTTFDGIQVQSAGRDGIRISGAAEYGILASGTTAAAVFNGDVTVTGTLSKGGGSFKIDHPLNPANKYLQHSFVESPDMMNVYNGNVTLNAAGEAIVKLPDYFESLNRDFRYQLTAIGKPGPNLYIADKITDNHFKIAGGQPGMEVSWQVTGIRQDPWANANRIKVEEEKKPEERGYYLNPKLYGQPESRNIVNVVYVNESEHNALSQK